MIKTVDMCKDLHIDFPEIPEVSEEEKSAPKDFYVFEGPKAPTVIHIPIFNIKNCGDKGNCPITALWLLKCSNYHNIIIIINYN